MAIAGSIRSYLTSALPTTELISLTLVQTLGDFPSTVTSAFTETRFNEAGYEDLD
jgi:hypothetical protein